MAFIAGHNTQDVGTISCGTNTVYLNNAIGDHDDSTGYLSGDHQVLTNGLHAWVKAGWGTAYYKMAVYEDTGTLSTCVKVAESSEVSTTSTAWVTLDFDVGNVTLENGKRYICGIIARHSSGTTINCKLAFGYDDVANTNDGYFLNVGSYAFPDDLTGFTLVSDRYNLWMEYEETSSGPTTYSGIHTTDSYITVPRQYTRPSQDITFTNWYNSSGILGSPTLPDLNTWTDHGPIIISASGYWDGLVPESAHGDDWDYIFWGGFGINTIKYNNEYLVYYPAASGYDGAEESVAGRAVGLAYSSDGISYTKYSGNPVSRYMPSNQTEEGTSSWAPVISGNTLLSFWGANIWISENQINSNMMYSTSTDGRNLIAPSGIAAAYNDADFYGQGDELFPSMAILNNGIYYVYYMINGVAGATGKLGVAFGTTPVLSSGVQVLNTNNNTIWAWGGCSYTQLDTYEYYVNISCGGRSDQNTGYPDTAEWRRIETYKLDIRTPNRFTGPLRVYEKRGSNPTFSGVISDGVILCDTDNDLWRMYYRAVGTISGVYGYVGMMTAPITYNTGHNKISDDVIHDSSYIYYGF